MQTEKLNFVRRYVLENGTYAGDNYGDFSSAPIAGHESEADRRVQLLKITREGKKDILLVHFQVHQSLTSGVAKKDLSADITGSLRMYLEPELDCQMIYFTGGAGNINPMSRIPEENLLKERDYLAYGRALSDYIEGAQDAYRELQGDKIRVRQRMITCKTNHAGDSKIEVATYLWNEFRRTSDWKTWNEEAIKAGLNSIFHAEAIIYNIALPPEKDIELNAISIGDVAFCMAPYELFDTTARQVMDPSPFPLTIMVTCCHNARDYIPSKLGYEHGGYSSDSSQFCCGTAEKMVENYYQMLDELTKLK